MLSALVLARASGRTKIKQVLNSLHTRTQFRERKMKRLLLVSLVVFIALGIKVQGEETAPLKLVQTITLPAAIKGHFDHFEVDLKGGRLFATPEGYKSVLVFETKAGKKVANIKVDGDTLEAMALEKSSPKIFVNNKAKNQVDVIDREKNEVIESWPVTKCKTNVAIGLDEAGHRLFVACR